jgi:hypothetical protein
MLRLAGDDSVTPTRERDERRRLASSVTGKTGVGRCTAAGQLAMIVGEPGLGNSRVLSTPINVAAAPCFDITTRLLHSGERARCENCLHCFMRCSF